MLVVLQFILVLKFIFFALYFKLFVLLLVGDGSYAPLLDVPPGKFSFFYLELALEARLQKKGQLYSGENL
jgi:hypothetical protein